MRALVVDDSRAARAILGRMLTELGFDVFDAGNGREALARLEETGPADLALIDWNMPVMNGIDLAKSLRADARYATMLLVMATSETEVPKVASALDAGVNEYIMKPYSLDMLRDKLALLGLPVS